MARPPVFDSLVRARARELLKSGCTNEEVAAQLRQELEARGQKGPGARWVSDIRREKAAKLARVSAVKAPLPVVSSARWDQRSADFVAAVADELEVLVGETPEEQGELALGHLVRRTPGLRAGHGARYLAAGRVVDALSEGGFGLVLGALYRPEDFVALAKMVSEKPIGPSEADTRERAIRLLEGAIAIVKGSK